MLISGVALSESELTLAAGTSRTLKCTLLPENTIEPPERVEWSSTNEKVAAVNQEGLVKAVGTGSAVITVAVKGRASEHAFTAQCRVTVRFADVPEDAYYTDAVYWALDQGVTAGVSAAKFQPNGTCTRAQAVTFLYRINGSPKKGSAAKFKDVEKGSWYADAVAWAVETGVVQGTSSTTFAPYAKCTRAQIVTMIWRCRHQKPGNAKQFSDIVSGSYCDVPVRWAASVGITSGTGSNRFSPDAPCTRAQIITMFRRCADKKLAIYDKSVWQVPYERAAAVLDQVGWDLKSAFLWSVGLSYYHDNIDISAGSEVLANYGFEHHCGDCYVYAATFYTMAIDLGYDAHQVFGYVPRRGGGKITHSWVEINMNGTTYVFDPDFQYSTGRNGYKITYGTSGTWVYIDYRRIN